MSLGKVEITQDFHIQSVSAGKQGIFRKCVVDNEDEETYFFWALNPPFTSHIKYYLLLNQALLFLPHEAEEVAKY